MNQTIILSKINLSIALVWIFHISGILGIIYSNSSWFIAATPFNLTLSFVLLIINIEWSKKMIFLVVLCFFTGMISEILGVRYGFIFGDYSYGEALGYKMYGVPLIIGINWCILVFITGYISQYFLDSFWGKIFLGISLMIFLDLIIEPVAPILDFWAFKSGLASFHNYLGWAIVAFPLQFIYHKMKLKIEGTFPFHLFFLQILFFTIILLKINTTTI